MKAPPDDRPLTEAEKAALSKGRTIARDGQRLNFEQWMAKRIAEQGGRPTSKHPVSPRLRQWLRQYGRICEEQERHLKKEQELRSKMEAHVANIPRSESDPKFLVTPPFLLKGQKRKKGHREFERRASDHPKHVTQFLDDINDYEDCVYEILDRDFGKNNWTRNMGGLHPLERALREVLGVTSADDGYDQVRKDATNHRKTRARQRRKTRRTNPAS